MTETNSKVAVFRYIDMTGGVNACWPWKGNIASHGRPYFYSNGRKLIAYRVVYELTTGVTLEKNTGVIRHSCDNPVCCNPKHLTLGSHQENMDDMKQRERHGLPHHVVKAIKRLLAAKRTQEEIAELYGISRELVSAISVGRVYKHIKENDDE